MKTSISTIIVVIFSSIVVFSSGLDSLNTAEYAESYINLSKSCANSVAIDEIINNTPDNYIYTKTFRFPYIFKSKIKKVFDNLEEKQSESKVLNALIIIHYLNGSKDTIGFNSNDNIITYNDKSYKYSYNFNLLQAIYDVLPTQFFKEELIKFIIW